VYVCPLVSKFDRCLGLHNTVPCIFACVCHSVHLNERAAVLCTCLCLMSDVEHHVHFVLSILTCLGLSHKCCSLENVPLHKLYVHHFFAHTFQ
jgi:hypothetical protein